MPKHLNKHALRIWKENSRICPEVARQAWMMDESVQYSRIQWSKCKYPKNQMKHTKEGWHRIAYFGQSKVARLLMVSNLKLLPGFASI